MNLFLLLVAAALSMAVKDFFATLLMIAEAEGRAVWAGVLDGASTLAGVVLTVLGAGTVILHGVDARSMAVIGAMLAADILGTPVWTTFGARLRRKRGVDPALTDLVVWAQSLGYVPAAGVRP